MASGSPSRTRACLDPERFERTLCITRFDPEHRSKEPAASLIAGLERDGVRVIGLERKGKLSLGAWMPLVKLLRSEDVDVLHGHMFGSNVWAAILGRLCRVPAVVAHEHMWSYDGGRSRAVVDRQLIARGSGAFIAVSENRSRPHGHLRRPATPKTSSSSRMASRLRSPRLGPRRRASLGLGADERVIGSVGHLRPEKAFETLVEAAALLRDQVAGLKVLIAGEGGERDDARRV